MNNLFHYLFVAFFIMEYSLRSFRRLRFFGLFKNDQTITVHQVKEAVAFEIYKMRPFSGFISRFFVLFRPILKQLRNFGGLNFGELFRRKFVPANIFGFNVHKFLMLSERWFVFRNVGIS